MSQPRVRERRIVTRRVTVPGNLARGCADFNSGRFFECHESFEEIWHEEQGPLRNFYKGLIQIAAAFVHLSRGKYTGADRLLRTGLGYLEPYRPEGAMGFDVEAICRAAEDVHARLTAAGPGAVGTLDLARRPHYVFDAGKLRAEAVKWAAWGFNGEGGSRVMEITVAE